MLHLNFDTITYRIAKPTFKTQKYLETLLASITMIDETYKFEVLDNYYTIGCIINSKTNARYMS